MNDTSERRTAKRDLFTVTVEYSLVTDNMPGDSSAKWQGLTTNISNEGLGLIITTPVEKGQCIKLHGDKLANKLLTGNVRWCSKVSEGIYRTGLRLN